MRTRLALLFTVPIVAVAGLLLADDAKPPESLAAVNALLNRYAEALTKNDASAMSSCWTVDAEFTDEEGTTTKGRESILASVAKALADAKGSTYAFSTKTARFPTPDVALFEGVCTTTDPAGGSDKSRYSAVAVRVKGQWALASVWDLPDNAAPNSSAKSLAELQWLVGEWQGDGKAPIRLSIKPALNNQFLMFDYTVPIEDGNMSIVKYLGYDAAQGKLCSWAFDSRGGHGTSLWNRDGNVWTGDTSGVLSDGRTGTATLRIKYIGNDKFEYESADRQLAGQPVPDSKATYTRVTRSPSGGPTP